MAKKTANFFDVDKNLIHSAEGVQSMTAAKKLPECDKAFYVIFTNAYGIISTAFQRSDFRGNWVTMSSIEAARVAGRKLTHAH